MPYHLESPLLGGDLGVGKLVIRELLIEISRPSDPPLTPPKRGIICAIIKYVDLTNFYKHGLCCAADGAFIRRCLFNGIPADLTDIIIHGLVFPQII